MKFFGDLETYCETPIKYGVHRYAEKAEVLLFSWAIDDGEVSVWDVTASPELPFALEQDLIEADEVWFQNSPFDRTVLQHARPDIFDLINPLKWRDTMIQAYEHSLPGALGILCETLGVPTSEAKDKRGIELVRLFCMPPTKASVRKERATRLTHPKEWAEFMSYAGSDILAMRACHKRMPTWNYPGNAFEMSLWQLDQTINTRGVCVDVDLAESAVRAVDKEQVSLAHRAANMTEGDAESATQRDKMLAHILKEYGITLPDMRASTLERRIEDPNLPEPLRDLLAVRLQATTTSTSKYKKLLSSVSADNRLRGTLQFCGASRTGRWAGRLFQPQNCPRPTLENDDIEAGILALKNDTADLCFPNVMALASSAIRGSIVAAPGKKLVIADLSAIEGRVLAWLAGEEWKLQAFRDYDNKVGPDLYNVSYSKSFNVKPEEVTKPQRQIGKTQELALGFQGGVGAFMTFATAFGIDLEKIALDAYDTLPRNLKNEAIEFLKYSKSSGGKTFGLSDNAFVTCDTFKRAWRRGHPATVKLWEELKDAMIQALNNKGETFTAGPHLKLRRDGNWLRMRLPSGRYLCYPSPKIEDGQFSYLGLNQYSRKWERVRSYAGKLAENATQAVARDILAHGAVNAESHGFDIVLSVHDELLCETPDVEEFTHEGLALCMSRQPIWAPTIPLAAEGFETYRYRK